MARLRAEGLAGTHMIRRAGDAARGTSPASSPADPRGGIDLYNDSTVRRYRAGIRPVSAARGPGYNGTGPGSQRRPGAGGRFGTRRSVGAALGVLREVQGAVGD